MPYREYEATVQHFEEVHQFSYFPENHSTLDADDALRLRKNKDLVLKMKEAHLLQDHRK